MPPVSPRRRQAPSAFLLLGAGLTHPLTDSVGDRRVEQSGDVAELAVLGDVAKQPSHELAAAGLGQLGADQDLAWLRDGSDLAGDVLTQLLHELVAPGLVLRDAALRRDERDDRLSGRRVVGADNGRFGDGWMADERVLDLSRGDAMTGDVHHVVDPAQEPEVAVVVLL